MVGRVLQVPDAPERVATELPDGFAQRVFKMIRAALLAQAESFMDELE